MTANNHSSVLCSFHRRMFARSCVLPDRLIGEFIGQVYQYLYPKNGYCIDLKNSEMNESAPWCGMLSS